MTYINKKKLIYIYQKTYYYNNIDETMMHILVIHGDKETYNFGLSICVAHFNGNML
jgi:hypothetical protein